VTLAPLPPPVRIVANRAADRESAASPSSISPFSAAEASEARRLIQSLPGFAPTPLHRLEGLAREAGLGGIFYKDEAPRFGLQSFKALGGAHAVYRVAEEHLRAEGAAATASPLDLIAGRYRSELESLTLACATDGNHGRAVAWAARMFGCPCVVFLHEHVSEGRARAIEAYGGRIERVPGNYDDSVRAAAAAAAAEGWTIVSDTAYPGYTRIPQFVMTGYTQIAAEAMAQAPRPDAFSHVIVQAGAGALAAGILTHFWQELGVGRPRFVIVESAEADCYLRSAAAGKIVTVGGALDTVMAGLACGEPSISAWELLGRGADDFVSLSDDAVAPVMRLLAEAPFGDSPITGGESGVAGLALLLAARSSPEASAALGFDERSHVLVIGTEGATDPDAYHRLTGLEPPGGGEKVDA